MSDSDVRTALIGRRFASIQDLEGTLKAYEEHAGYYEDRRAGSTRERERDRSAPRDRDRSTPRSAQVYYTYDSDEEARGVSEGKSVRFQVDEYDDVDSEADDAGSDAEVVFQAVSERPRDRDRDRRDWRNPPSAPPTPGHTADACRKQCPACSKAHPVGECPVAKALESLKVWTTVEENAVAASKLPVAVQQHLNC
ncbi:hypothetical protein ATCC90586_011332 [Pythium insidiosum]|nr:hypothetical protein ATCC90586_011332 [Pythium insidiosum]